MNDLVQVSTFLLHRDWWFAGVLSFFILLSLALTIPKMSEDSDLQRFDPLGEARLSLARGVPTVAWERMLACERNIEAPSTGLIGPYGASLLQLTPLQAASCLYGLCTSAKAMAEGRLHVEASCVKELCNPFPILLNPPRNKNTHWGESSRSCVGVSNN